MLGGAITAGTDDIGTIYYNPAAIHKDSPGVDVSLVQPRVNTFGFGQFWNEEEQSALNREIGLKPLLISFKVKIKDFDIAFIKIGKSDWQDKFNAKNEFVSNNVQSIQNFEYDFSGSDDWYGLGTSFELKPKLHLGVSQFVSISKFSYKNNILLEAIDLSLDTNQQTKYFNSSLDSSYNNLGLITKVGLLYDTKKHDLGLTITTPTFLRFVKGGSFNKSTVSINSGNTNIRGLIDTELSPVIKTPWEVNFGYSLSLNSKHKLWFNSSYHSQIEDYVMTEILAINDKVDWVNGNKSIFNFGVGYSAQINPQFQLSGGVRTNNFAYKNKIAEEGTMRNIILDGDHMHFTLSTKFIYRRNTILLGFDWGTLVSVSDEESFKGFENIGILAPNTQGLTKNSFGILFTYGFILDELKKEIK